MFPNMKLGTKILLGFLIILVILAAISLLAIVNIGGIVENASQVIEGNKLTASIVEKKIDHLEWAIKLNEFITDPEVNELVVNTDPRKCGFGQWYYSSDREEAQTLVPQITSTLKAIEASHNALHASALEIADKYVDVDPSWSGFFPKKKGIITSG